MPDISSGRRIVFTGKQQVEIECARRIAMRPQAPMTAFDGLQRVKQL